MAIEVRLLGALELRGPDGVVPLAGDRLRTLVALLALAAPHPVSNDRIIDAVWGDDPPGNPLNALQAQVSQLRRLVGRDTVALAPMGYRLAVEPDAVDVNRLASRSREGADAARLGDHQRAAACYREALALCRGPLLADLDDRPFARDAVARLDALVLLAREGLLDAELALGHHAEVITEASAVLVSHPLHERFHAQLMTALYRSGRQSDALRAYQRARTTLAEEMGLEPGPELRALEQAVLAQDPSLAPPGPGASGAATGLGSAGAAVPVGHVPPPASAPDRPSLPAVGAPLPPLPLTSFIGRDADAAALTSVLDVARLVTVVGPAGVGKTRLVREVVGRMGAAGETVFVELAPLTLGVAVPEAVATALGSRDGLASPDGNAGPAQRAIERIGDRPAIVVLDNCEHLLDAAADCALTLLGGCPGVRLVATSREPLAVDGEIQVALDPLPPADAVRLFVERARAVQPALDADHEAGELAELCRHLDGLPLAIELAAARAKTLPIPQIAEMLEDRFQLLRSNSRAASSRHSGLRAAIDGSYELLFADEQRAFRWLSPFAGGFTIDAASAVCGPEALDLVAKLVDRSLVRADTSGRQSRFGMLESLRAYGMDRLAEAGEWDDALCAHLDWCIALAEAAEPHVRSHEQLVWLARLDLEHDNLRAALARAVERWPEAALRLVGPLILPWWFRGRRQEGRHWAEAALAAAHDDVDPGLHARVLASCGLLAEAGGWSGEPGGLEQELELAEQRQRRAIEMSAGPGAELSAARARSLLAVTLHRRASIGAVIDPDEVAMLLVAAREVFERRGLDHEAGGLHMTDAREALLEGRLEDAAAALARSSEYSRRSGERFQAARIHWVEAQLADLSGRPADAEQHLAEAHRLSDEMGMAHLAAEYAEQLADLASRVGDAERAAHWLAYGEERRSGWAMYDKIVVAASRNLAGQRARDAGELDAARQAHLDALAAYRDGGVVGGIAFTRSCLGFLAAQQGALDEAAAHHAAALEAALASGDLVAVALAVEGAAGLVAEAEPARGARLVGAARALRRGSGSVAPPTHRADVAGLETLLQARLGPAEFTSAVAEGDALATDRAVALARDLHAAHTVDVRQPVGARS